MHLENEAALGPDASDAPLRPPYYEAHCSFLQIYNDQITDLLASHTLPAAAADHPNATPPRTPPPSVAGRGSPLPTPKPSPKAGTSSFHGAAGAPGHLRIREAPGRGTYVEGLSEVAVSSREECAHLLALGNDQGHTARTPTPCTAHSAHC